MKFGKVFRVLGVSLLLSILFAAIPAIPALAANSISLSPTSGKVGSTVDVSGTDWTVYAYAGTDEYYAVIYFAQDNISVGGSSIIGDPTNDDAHTYDLMSGYTDYLIDENGDFDASFTVPTRLTDGSADANVGAGTYYVYITTTKIDNATGDEIDNHSVKAKATFTVTAAGTLDPLSPAQGASGSQITVSGSNFAASSAITFKFDNVTITPTSGDTVTRSSGVFLTYVTIPQATPGVHTITVTVAGSTASGQFTITASPGLDPLTPAQGPVGTDVTLSGANFPASTALTFRYDDITVTPISGDAVTRSSGVFITHIVIPNSTVGVHTVTVTAGTASAVGQFTVTASTTTTTTTTTTSTTTTPTTPTTTTTTTKPPGKAVLSINASGANIGATIGISGAGFSPNAKISILIDTTEVYTTTSTPNGLIAVTFEVPPVKHGDHTLTATDGTNSGSAIYTIESVPPAIPQPLSPALGAKVKSPITFSWGPSVDPAPASNPVTYELQIATSETFTGSSVVIDRSLPKDTVSYSLTAAEETQLEGRTTAYYWRVDASDAASNLSPWSAAGSFYAPGGGASSFPSWALWTAISVGAVLVFLLGYWIGRRSAFYY